MKILHICTGFNLDFNGGITNYVRCIAKSQAQNGNDVFIMADGGSNDGYKVINYKSEIKAWSLYNKTDLKALERVKSLLENENFDLVHIHMMLNMDQDLYKVLLQLNVRYIVSLHDYWMICPRIQMIHPGRERCTHAGEQCVRCFSIIEKNYFIMRIFRKVFGARFTANFPVRSKEIYTIWGQNCKKLLEGAQALLPVSNRVGEIYKDSGINGKYTVLNIGNISAESFNKSYIYHPQRYINLIILSSVSKVKGGELFCKLLEEVRNPVLKIHFYGRCSKKSARMLKKHNIENHGSYKQTELKEILASMDMGVMTPIWEDNGPQVVMEMINNHLPVFATKMGGIPDFVNNENGFLFDPFSAEGRMSAVNFLNSLTHEKIAEMKQNIYRLLTPQEHYEQLMHVYRDVLKTDDANKI